MLEYCKSIGGNLVISPGLNEYLRRLNNKSDNKEIALTHPDFPEYFFVPKQWKTFDVVHGARKPQHYYDGNSVTLFFAIRRGF